MGGIDLEHLPKRVNLRPKIIRGRSPTLPQAVAPYLLNEKDPAWLELSKMSKSALRQFLAALYFAYTKRNTRKYLTIKKRRRILPSTINRKDDTMGSKQKTQTNYLQTTAVCLLAGGAFIGIADMLGGSFRDWFAATLLIGMLVVLAADYRK